MDQRRLILFLVFSFALVMLWDAWERHNNPRPPVAAAHPDYPPAHYLAAGEASAERLAHQPRA